MIYQNKILNKLYYVPQVLGLSTNIQFLTSLAQHPEFEAGHVHTDFIPQHSEALFPPQTVSSSTICQAAVAMVMKQQQQVTEMTRNTLGLYT